MHNRYALVVGGVGLDIGGRPHAPLVSHDSNPGHVTVALGGVGRNIAHNLRLLDVPVRLLTALGRDDAGRRIQASCDALGIDLSGSLVTPDAATATYLFIADHNGDMALALSDMEIYRHITPAYLEQQRDLIDGAAVVVLDANLPAQTIDWLCAHCPAPIFADPVSTAKAGRMRAALGAMHTLKPNRIEAELLSGVPIDGPDGLERAAQALLSLGLARVFISLAGDGVYCAERGATAALVPCVPADMVGTTGCGDAFTAALVWAFLHDMDLESAGRAGVAAAAIAMEGPETINPKLCAADMLRRAGLHSKQEEF